MNIEKLKRQRLINIVTFSLIVLVNAYLAFYPLKGLTNIALFKDKNSIFPISQELFYIYLLVLIGQLIYTIFQAGNMRYRENISAKCLNCLGWTFSALNILNIGQIISFQLKLYIITFLISLSQFLLLRVVNENIKDDEEVMDEKFYVRNPFSFYLAWISYCLFAITSLVFINIFSNLTAIMVLLLIYYLMISTIALRNKNIGLLVATILINLLLLKGDFPIKWFIILACFLLLALIFFIQIKANKKEREYYIKRLSKNIK